MKYNSVQITKSYELKKLKIVLKMKKFLNGEIEINQNS